MGSPLSKSKSRSGSPPPTSQTIPPITVEAVQHWSTFGAASTASATRVQPTDWKTKPFRKSRSSTWDIPVPSTELGKLINGFLPNQMEDKWFVYSTAEEEGVLRVHFFRSWTGHKIYEVEVSQAGGEWKIVKGTWEMDKKVWNGNDEEHIKEDVVELCHWVLGVKF